MEKTQAYTERFIMHTELYMLLTGKDAQQLSLEDMERIGALINLQSQQSDHGVDGTVNTNKFA